MSRAERRRKEKREGLEIKILVICIIIFAVIFLIMRLKKDKTNTENTIINQTNIEEIQTSQNDITENNIVENVIDNTIENEVENENISNITENTTKQSNSSNENSSGGAGITDKKQASIELVEQEWGPDDTVDFVFDYVNENGEYVIAVRDKNSATIKCYYRVNLETKTVELD